MNGPRATVVELAVVRLPLRDFFDTEGCMEHCLCNLHGAWFIGGTTPAGGSFGLVVPSAERQVKSANAPEQKILIDFSLMLTHVKATIEGSLLKTGVHKLRVNK